MNFNDDISLREEYSHCLKDKYFSYKCDNPKEPDAMIAYIELK